MNLLNDYEVAAVAAEIGLFEYPNPNALASTTGLAEQAIGILGPGPQAVALAGVYVHPATAVTANDTNYATFVIAKRTGGGSAVTIATATTQTTAQTLGTGNWTQWAPVLIPAVSGAFISPGDAITLTITKTGGSGVNIPQFYLAGFTSIK